MLEHSCKRAGAAGCGFTAKADTEEELMQVVVEHARKVHGVTVMTDTIASYLRDMARQT
jgi:predicted small metal-binding protein